MRQEDLQKIQLDLVKRVSESLAKNANTGSGLPLDEILADSIYFEKNRLKDEKDSRLAREEHAFYDQIKKGLGRAAETDLMERVRQVISRYTEEVSGHFDERVYQIVTKAGAPLMGLLLNAASPKLLLNNMPDRQSFDAAVKIQGEVEHLRRLREKGTIILVPTHVSNLDSIVIGYSLFRLGLPPFIYGAGLNLFSNPLIGYFMRNLGAYTVDRRKTDPLYKRVLKEYATLTLENRYDNIFFPGGTRSRSGAIEKKLKLGLAGTGIPAYINNLRAKKSNPRIFFVPCTLSFQLVLEAETLIDDFLKEVGKSRYIITDDEFAQPRRVIRFMGQLLELDSDIFFTIGRGLDPFGNEVDDDGNSLDPCHRVIDTAEYVMRDGVPTHDAQRDAEFTREVGARLVDTFARDNLVQSTHLTARVVFTLMRKKNPKQNLIRVLRSGPEQDTFDLREVYTEMDILLRELQSQQQRGQIRLGPVVSQGNADEVVADGIRHFSTYHGVPAVKREGVVLRVMQPALLFYYQNRLEGYGLEDLNQVLPALSADHMRLRGGQ